MENFTGWFSTEELSLCLSSKLHLLTVLSLNGRLGHMFADEY